MLTFVVYKPLSYTCIMGKPIQFKSLIVWENDDYIIINKPSGISSLPERDTTRENLLGLAKGYSEDAQLCHRIDKETTGILVIAKHPEAYRNLAIQFEGREVDKVYHAVVHGIHNFTDELIDLPIFQSSKGSVRIDQMLGKFSETTFNTVATYQKHTLVACEPITGRMHQIRIHLASIGAPIVCDPAYGGPMIYLSQIKRKFNLKKQTEELPLMQRVALHAYQISFAGLDGQKIEVQAPYPKDFRALVTQLEKNS